MLLFWDVGYGNLPYFWICIGANLGISWYYSKKKLVHGYTQCIDRYFWQAAKPDGLRILPNETSIGPKIRSNPRGVFDKSVVSTPRVETLLPYFDTGLGEVLGFPAGIGTLTWRNHLKPASWTLKILGWTTRENIWRWCGGGGGQITDFRKPLEAPL